VLEAVLFHVAGEEVIAHAGLSFCVALFRVPVREKAAISGVQL
jgi:hypothetical protein